MEQCNYVLKDYKIVVKNNIESKDQYIFPYLHLCIFTRDGTILRKGEWLRNILVYKMIKSAIGSHHDWPEEFVKLIISYLSKEDDLVVDPFAGSGVVPLVARAMNRGYIGIELDKSQYEEMYQRCSTSTLPF
jgi:DNA modification methylase